MKVNSSRFGQLTIDKSEIIHVKEGLLGFDKLTKFIVVDPGDQTLILWLQSVDDEKLAFPIIEPRIFMPDYRVKLLPAELNSLELENLNDATVYTILTIPQKIDEMSANLKAPLIINNKTRVARQIVLQDSKLEVKYPMYLDLKKYIVNFSTGAEPTRTKINVSEETVKRHSPSAPNQEL